ncbi:hypothetical protein [Bradyrhizobium sp. STM 3843]|uniref:hypothetical protein n=1 Tax=Bradyrhizobium sp. STM 3843 TaxID=551947 RepID=UPI0015863138|nr:hypothetical protein [Bradyrhizobium sp. STM 3843]
MKATASVKATGGAHASAMEATTASAKASTWVEAATGRMETTAAVKPAATAVKAAAAVETAATAVETATAAAMKASASTASTASTAAAAWLRLGEAGECDACNSPREDCGKRERNLSAGNAHVFLPCRNGGREKPATPRTALGTIWGANKFRASVRRPCCTTRATWR